MGEFNCTHDSGKLVTLSRLLHNNLRTRKLRHFVHIWIFKHDFITYLLPCMGYRDGINQTRLWVQIRPHGPDHSIARTQQGSFIKSKRRGRRVFGGGGSCHFQGIARVAENNTIQLSLWCTLVREHRDLS